MIWIPFDAILVFSLPFMMINQFKASTEAYYVCLYIISGAFIYLYARLTKLKWAVSLKSGWALGTIMGVFFGLAFLSLASMSKPTIEQDFLSAAMLPYLWRGLLYGLASAAMISVFPFVVVWRSFAGANPGIIRKVGVTAVAVISIASMSFLYNTGISDFSKHTLKNQMAKSMIASIPTIISGNPLAAPITNVFLQLSESVMSSNRAISVEKIETPKSQTTSGGIN